MIDLISFDIKFFICKDNKAFQNVFFNSILIHLDIFISFNFVKLMKS